MVKQDPLEAGNKLQPDVNANGVHLSVFSIVAICAVAIVSGLLITAVAFKCYRRRQIRNAQSRLSSAIKKGLKETPSSSKRSSRSSSVVKLTKATSPISPPEHPAGPGEKLSPGSFSMRPDNMESPHHVGKQDYSHHIEYEKGDRTPEKDEEAKMRLEQKQEPKYLGSLNFSMEYDFDKSALLVNIMSLVDLPPRDPSTGGCDPYVKLQLLPEKRHKCKTRVLRKTLNPVYDETFTFYGIASNQLHGMTLHFVILSFDRFSRDAIMGEVLYPLKAEELTSNKTTTLCREITPRHLKFRMQGCGELLVSLCYQPAANRLTVVVLKARTLPKMDLSGLSDPYVKIYLLYNGQRIAKKKTHVKKRTLNPVFNESFLFDVPYNEGLQNISLEFLVLDWDRMTKNEVVGRLEIGCRSLGGPESHHWNEVINCPRKQIAEWHKLSEH
ncbi:synaptotagmin-11-like isoform X2 [Mya arenaria]|uniref:synaptotagmin-11-like isoform X2 n=1 Tax=Mya arenaria TaxID=6604 RepID=UPI0022E24698|nr:synaptotagmin-11-like isoform X2 [Mya arenaria]